MGQVPSRSPFPVPAANSETSLLRSFIATFIGTAVVCMALSASAGIFGAKSLEMAFAGALASAAFVAVLGPYTIAVYGLTMQWANMVARAMVARSAWGSYPQFRHPVSFWGSMATSFAVVAGAFAGQGMALLLFWSSSDMALGLPAPTDNRGSFAAILSVAVPHAFYLALHAYAMLQVDRYYRKSAVSPKIRGERITNGLFMRAFATFAIEVAFGLALSAYATASFNETAHLTQWIVLLAVGPSGKTLLPTVVGPLLGFVIFAFGAFILFYNEEDVVKENSAAPTMALRKGSANSP